jgi:hypothetical protein
VPGGLAPTAFSKPDATILSVEEYSGRRFEMPAITAKRSGL